MGMVKYSQRVGCLTGIVAVFQVEDVGVFVEVVDRRDLSNPCHTYIVQGVSVRQHSVEEAP